MWCYRSLDETLRETVSETSFQRFSALVCVWKFCQVNKEERNTLKRALPEPFDTITSFFFFFVYLYLHFVSHHGSTLTPFVWNLQRFKEIKTLPQNMLQQLLCNLQPTGTSAEKNLAGFSSSYKQGTTGEIYEN